VPADSTAAHEHDRATVADAAVDEQLRALTTDGYVHVRGCALDEWSAFATARQLVDAAANRSGISPLAVVGDFVLPPGPTRTRGFQTLHIDFGLPLDLRVVRDVARFTALHVPMDRGRPTAVTRLVPVVGLFAQRTWPSFVELLERFAAYGATHGAWDDTSDYAEGSLARIVEAADAEPSLPSVRTEPGFLCGMEFDDVRAEIAFFARHGLRVTEVQRDVRLDAGDLLVFDDLVVAHGRDGSRAPAELRQWVFGHRGLDVTAQRALRDRWLETMATQVADAVEVTQP
jgi:hypothetical protein